ncbi:hypothetical protein KEJ45_00615 [Candidatus Bathyarchaeota archaeon]|nr:hypothetical protein [Candidatus Bathyarchaeota archaeon]
MKKSIIVPLILLMLLPTLSLSIPKIFAETSTELQILPENNFFAANTTASGTKFVLTVKVVNVEDLMSWQIGVRWNESLLTFSNISIPSDNVFAGQSYITAGPDTSVPGYVVYGAAIFDPSATFSGNGTLCQIELEILEITDVPALCEIAFDNIGVDTFLLNHEGLDIEGGFTTTSAYFIYEYAYLQTHTVAVGDETFEVSTYSNGEIEPDSVVALIEDTAIAFNVTGESGHFGFVNVTVPKALLNSDSTWTVYLNGVETSAQVTSNATHTFIYVEFTFESPIEVKIVGTWIVPEFATIVSLVTLLMGTTLVTTTIIKLKARKK